MTKATGNPVGHPNCRLTDEQRFEMKVDRSGECHRWIGAHNEHGYGNFRYEARTRRAHIVALLLAGVEIPTGKTVDHVWARGCQYRDCVRVDHLEVVSHRENILRGGGPAAVNARKQVCKRGHQLSENLYKSRGYRRCLTCAEMYKVRRRKGALPTPSSCRVPV